MLLLASLVAASARAVQERLLADEQRRELEAERRIALTLQEADKRKDEFLAVLAHELRNPLAPAALTLETLRRKTPPASEAARAQELIARQLRHMARLVDDLFDVSRITRGKIELRLETTDFRDAVKHGIETARPQLTERRHELVVVLPEAPLPVRGDEMRLSQVVGNLVNNAARYTDEGGRIEIWVERRGNEAILRVRDNGIGIRSDMIDDIFGLFVQVRGDRSTLRGGLGIGLSLVKQLTEMHGGRVVAESEGSGRGSTFTVTLPALEPLSLSTSSRPSEDEEPVDFPLGILVVDDNVDAAKALAGLLELWGHTTRVAHDGAAALDAARAASPDVILLDLDLPKVSGYDVASALRRERDSAELLLVALSGFGSEQHRERARSAGFDHHLVKPVDIAALRSLLRETAGRTTAAYRRTRNRAIR
jgi:CheY-like chemotaxis protein/nitrogen-specific signal transduction histidine kinase